MRDAMTRDPPAAIWRVELLGGPRAVSGATVLTRFGSRKIAALLARLAMSPQRLHAREELIDLLWPDADPATGRNRLRQALSTLKRLLQPPGAGDVLLADRAGIRINPQAVSCDVLDFEACARDGRVAQARRLYRGELLPGFYDEWVQDERQRLQAVFDRLDAAAGGEPSPVAVPVMPGIGITLFPSRQLLLPSYLSAFFGRAAERRELAALLQTHRLVTVSGPGGSGKTRLAIETARDLAPRFETVLYVGLAELDRPPAVVEAIRQGLRLPPRGQEAQAQVVDYLSERDALLVLDNFEQLVAPGGGEVVERLLAALPRLRCLVTSRRVLLVAGERELTLAPLPLPQAAAPAAELAAVPSVALFVDRARGARPEFQVTARNAADLALLSRALEGLPLAIELAAARVRAMSVAEMAREIGRRRDWLATARLSAGREARHASLRAAIEWSWRLLDAGQRRFLSDLTVLRGGWTADAAAAVSAADEARTRLESLVADSLLQTQTDAWGRTRFSLLETIREYALEQGDPAALGAARARHRRHFLGEVRRSARLESSRLALDEANVEQALASAVDDGELALALELAVALRPFADTRGLEPRLVERLTQLAAAVPDGDGVCPIHMLLAEALTIACRLDEAVRHGQLAVDTAVTALQRAEADFVLARASWDRYLTAASHRPALEAALAVAQEAGAGHLQARLLNLLGTIALQDQRDLDAAEALFRQGIALAQRAGLQRLAAQGRFNLGIVHRRRRRFADGMACCDEVVDDCRRRGDLTLLADALHERGLALSEVRRWRESVAAMIECVDFCWRHRALISLLYALWNMARPLARTGEAAAAARLIGFAAAYWERHGGPLSAQDRRYVRRVEGLAAATIGRPAAAAALRDGELLTLPAAVELALGSAAS